MHKICLDQQAPDFTEIVLLRITSSFRMYVDKYLTIDFLNKVIHSRGFSKKKIKLEIAIFYPF